MTSLLAPSYTVTLGGQAWSEQAVAIDVRLRAAPVVDVATVRLAPGASLDAAVGDDAKIELDGGEGGATVLTGTVQAIRRTLEGIAVTVTDAGGTLAAFRPAATYEKVTAGTVIRNLCGDAGVDAGDVDDGVSLAFYVADPCRTALEHVARVAAWGGALARVSADGRLDATVVNAVTAEVALRYGRDLLAVEQSRVAAPVESFVVAGESGAGDTSAAQAHRATTDFFGGSRPDGPSATSRWRFEPALRTSGAATTAGDALGRAYRGGRDAGAITAILQPALRPGTVLELQDLPGGLAGGACWADRVDHHVSAAGAVTRARLRKGGDSFDPTSAISGGLPGL
jgi:prophage tail gpP-like protein